MRSFIALAAIVFVASASAHARAAELDNPRAWPIHYDGPMTHHGPAVLDNTNSPLPHFHVTWHGGPVQTTTTSYAIYWDPTGRYMSPTYATLIDRFLTDVGGSAIYAVGTEYGGSDGFVRNKSTFGGSFVDNTTRYPHHLRDADLQKEIEHAIVTNNWKFDLNATFFIMTARGAISPDSGFCAYHSAFPFQGDRKNPVVYAFVPYFGSLNGCNVPFGISPNDDPDADGAILNLSHEQEEAATDPLIDAWYDAVNGEIGDICIFAFGVPFTRHFGNIAINGDEYFLQEIWSERYRSCQPNL